LLEEVEQVADHVTIISGGRIVVSAALNEIKESHRDGEHVPTLDEIFIAHASSAADA
jgi:ABC-type multidrug transport system ATPase subunit